MTRYLLDTNHAGSLLRASSGLPSKLLAARDARFGLCLPAIGELWHMVFKSARAESNRAKLEALIQQFDVYPYDDIAAREFGRVLTDLRRIGRPIPVIDVQIAAIAIAKDLVLLTADNHFGNVPQVRCENWL